MAIVPTLGTGLFIGAGQALATGGPASLLCAYVFISLLVYCLTTAAAEVAAHMPALDGTMLTHTYHFASEHMGFSLGYLRWYSIALLVPFEITNAMVNLGLWIPGPQVAIRITIVASVVIGFNMLPEKAFKRSEAFFTGVKLVTTIGLVTMSIYIAVRGIPGTPARGFYYWRVPGPMNRYLAGGVMGHILGLAQCILYSTISFIFSPELIVARAEKQDSESTSTVLSVTRNDNFQILSLYIVSALAMSVVCPSNEPMLTNHGVGAGLSPYVVGARRAGVPTLPVIATTLILFSSVASARSFLFISSRTLCSLAETGHAPTIFKDRNSWGVPYASVIASSLLAALAYLSLAISPCAVFNFLMYFITTSGYISWLCSCMIYLRFRSTATAQRFTRLHQAYIQPYGAYFAILVCTSLFLGNVFITMISTPRLTVNLIPVFVALTTFLLLHLGHRAITYMKRLSEEEFVHDECSEMRETHFRGMRNE